MFIYIHICIGGSCTSGRREMDYSNSFFSFFLFGRNPPISWIFNLSLMIWSSRILREIELLVWCIISPQSSRGRFSYFYLLSLLFNSLFPFYCLLPLVVPEDYTPLHFTTEALQKHKVSLTWDEDDKHRQIDKLVTRERETSTLPLTPCLLLFDRKAALKWGIGEDIENDFSGR